MTRVVAVDWAGTQNHEERTIWVAEAAGPGRLARLEDGRSRLGVAAFLLEAAGAAGGDLVVGLDFAFSFPAWFLDEADLPDPPALWGRVAAEGEGWLARCDPPWWGRRGRLRPAGPEQYRATERLVVDQAPRCRPSPVFQVGGAGAVGTGTVRGMPLLAVLRRAGFAIWPFHRPGSGPVAVEIYPCALHGGERATEESRARFLARHPDLAGAHRALAVASQDAFDAATSALAMAAAGVDPARLAAKAVPPGAAVSAREGAIWLPD